MEEGREISLQPAYFELFGDDLNDARYSFNYVSPDNGGILTSKLQISMEMYLFLEWRRCT